MAVNDHVAREAQHPEVRERASSRVEDRRSAGPVRLGGGTGTGSMQQMLAHADPALRGRVVSAWQGSGGNLAVQRLLQPAGPAAASVAVQRDPNGTMEMPPAEIKGQDPNVVRLPGGSIKGNERPDDDTAKVMANIAATTTRAKGYMTNTKTEIIMAVDAFKGAAQGQLDAIDFDPSGYVALIPALVGAIGASVSMLCPPVAGVAIAVNFVTALSTTAGTTIAKAEGASIKQALKDGIANFARAVNDAQSSAMNSADGKLGPKLNDMAATEPGIWDMLVIGGERQQDDLISRLGVRNPAKQPPYGPVLAALMRSFAGWLATEKAQKGMTGFEKSLSDSVPDSEEFKARKKAVAAGVDEAGEAARKMAAEHAGETP